MWGRKNTASTQRRQQQAPRADRSAEIKGLDNKIAHLDHELIAYKRQMQQARSMATKKKLKSRAMEILKQKRQYERRRDQTVSQQMNMENVSFHIDSARSTAATVNAMKNARKEMKRNMVSIHEVDDLQDDMRELMDEMNDCNEALGQGFQHNDMDEDDLAAEFAMMDDEPPMRMPAVHSKPLPKVPSAARHSSQQRQPASVRSSSSSTSRRRVAAYAS